MSTIIGASPPPPGVTSNFQNPADVLWSVGLVTNGLALGLTTLVTLGRFYVRFWITGAVFLEDWFCFVSWFLNVGFCIVGLLGSLYGGGGYHAWEISPASMIKFQKLEYAAVIVYGPAVWCIKVTLLLILVRVFTPFRRIITGVWAFIYAMLLYYVIVTVVKVFRCSPIPAVWDPDKPGKCLDGFLLFTIDTSLSILTDVIILILPIPLVWSLQVTTKKKLRTIALLGAGGVATATSIVRLILVLNLDNSPYQLGDQTISIQRINLLVTAELSIGIICACLPAFNIFFASDRAHSQSRSRSIYVNTPLKLSNLFILTKSKVAGT
ncbi:integral membrane protein, partial [Rhexocercosporidium sp. MPI-PUGE-AT-0058]